MPLGLEPKLPKRLLGVAVARTPSSRLALSLLPARLAPAQKWAFYLSVKTATDQLTS